MNRANGHGKPPSPRRVRSGIRLRNRDSATATNWVAQRWLATIESAIDPAALREGFAYAKSGQTISLDIAPGVITAKVQGTAPQPYQTIIRITPFSEADWQQIIESMTGEALYAAALMGNDVPRTIDELFTSLGLRFLPEQIISSEFRVPNDGLAQDGNSELPPRRIDSTRNTPRKIDCTCRADANECKHAAAIGYLLAERFSEDPTAIFELYGMPAATVQERLRQQRSLRMRGVAAAHADPMIPESQIEPPALEDQLDDFWRCGPRLAELEQTPPPQHVKHALLRRLGPSTLGGRFPLVGLLASIYDAVADAAVHTRDQAEHIE